MSIEASLYETTSDKLAWLRTMVALALPRVKDPEARRRLEMALDETAPITNLAELAVATAEGLRDIECECTFARPQAMGTAHKENGDG